MGRLTQSVKNVALFLFGVVLVVLGYRTNEAHAQAKAEAARIEAARMEAEKLEAEKAKNAGCRGGYGNGQEEGREGKSQSEGKGKSQSQKEIETGKGQT